MIYETKTMTFKEALSFMNFYDTKIGTDRNMYTDFAKKGDKKYFICVDLTQTDINILREWERRIL